MDAPTRAVPLPGARSDNSRISATTNDGSLSIAADCLARGYAPVPLPLKSKKPTMRGWTKFRATVADLERYFSKQCNVGVLTGQASGVVDVDLDHPLAVELGDHFLPPTASVYGREGKPRSHRIYRVQGACPSSTFKSGSGAMLLEIRGDDHQSVWPGSVHPNGERVRWDTDGEPAEVTLDTLRGAASALAFAVREQLGECVRAKGRDERHVRSGVCAGIGEDSPDVVARAIKYLAAVPSAIAGQAGHCQTYAAATAMVHGFGLSPGAAFGVLNEHYNPRCQPPWSERDLRHKVDDAAIKAHSRPYRWLRDARSSSGREPIVLSLPDAAAAASRAPAPWCPTWAGDLIKRHPEMRAPIVEGVLRMGETMNLAAAPGTGKSVTGLQLALAIASGRRWLDTFKTARGKVLVLDNELHAETAANRLSALVARMGLAREEYADRVAVEILRGDLKDIHQLGDIFKQIELGMFSLIIVDAMYRALPEGADENKNADIMRVYNVVDQYAKRTGAAFCLIHHTSKGNQSGKDAIDVGAGAGSFSRAADVHLAFRPHKEPGHVVLSFAKLRSFAPLDPLVFRFDFPLYVPDLTGLDPSLLRPERPRREKGDGQSSGLGQKPKPMTVEQFVSMCCSAQPRGKDAIVQTAIEAGISEACAKRLFKVALEAGQILKSQVRTNESYRYEAASTGPPRAGRG